MTSKLIITSVHAERFGGLSGHRLDIPGEGMVVIHGLNEAGKSTLGELLTWLLVGPSSDSNVIRRLGKAGEILSGEMKGRLNDRPFLARGEFKITPRSWEIAKASARIYETDEPLTPEAWLHGLGDVDRANWHGIYRLWGQQLHDGGDADSEMRRAGLGTIAMSVDPRAVVRQLLGSSKVGSKLGDGDVSFNSVSTELKEVSQAVDLANNNIVEYNDRVAELDHLNVRMAELRDENLVLSRRRANLENFKNLDDLQAKESDAQAALREHPDAAEIWLPAVGQIHHLRTLIERWQRHLEVVKEAKGDYGRAVAAVGLSSAITPSEVVEKFSITVHDKVLVGKAVSEVAHAVAAHEEAIKAAAATEADLEAANETTVRVAARIGVDLDRVREVKLGSVEREFAKTRDQLTRIQGDILNVEDNVRTAEADLAEAAEAVRLASERWKQLGIGMSAVEWRQRGGNRSRATDGAPAIRRILPVIVLAPAVVVAAALAQWLVLALIVVAAVIAWIAVTTDSEIDHNPSTGEAADQVITAQTKLDLVRASLAGHQEKLAGKQEQLTEATRAMLDIGPRFGIDLPDHPEAIESTLADWREAQKLIEELDTARGHHADAKRRCDAAATARQERLAALDSVLAGFGLPAGIDPDAAEHIANDHVELVAAAARLTGAVAAAESTRGELDVLLGPAAIEVAGWKSDDILTRAEEAAALHATHETAAHEARNASDRISDFIGGNSELAALIDAGFDTVRADHDLEEIREQLSELDRQQQDLAEKIGVLKKEIDNLESEQQLADLRLAQGSLEDARAEIGLEVASRRLAALVLQNVADDYERKNQPELIRRTGELAVGVAKGWSGVEVRLDGDKSASLMVNLTNGSAVPVASLSTGARALLYLSLRVAMAEHDTRRRGVALPLVCDDPLVHIDDERAGSAMRLLADASRSRQVVMFTCHERTMEVAESIGVVTHRM